WCAAAGVEAGFSFELAFISASATWELHLDEGLAEDEVDQSKHDRYHYHGHDHDKRHSPQLCRARPDDLAELADDVLEAPDEAPALRGRGGSLHSIRPWVGGNYSGHRSYT